MLSRVKRMTYGKIEEAAKEIWMSTCILPSSTASCRSSKIVYREIVMF